MNWIQVFTIIGILGGFTMWLLQRVDNDIKTLTQDVKTLAARADSDNKTVHRRMDQLYQVIIDLLNKK